MAVSQIVIPIPENIGICGTAIFIRYSVNSLVVVVVYGSGDAVSSKSTIDFSWWNLKKRVKEKRDYFNLVLCYVMLPYFLSKMSGYT